MSIRSDVENAFVKASFYDKIKSKSEFWIGLDDLAKANHFTWADGVTPLEYSSWGGGQPEETSLRNCAVGSMPPFGNGTLTWAMANCTSQNAFLCKRKAAVPAPVSSTVYNGQQYLFFSERYSWDSAEQTCRQLDGNLADIASNQENMALARSVAVLDAPLCDAMGWIGMAYSNASSAFGWSSGAGYSFRAWGPSQPDASQRCGQLTAAAYCGSNNPVGTWQTADCSLRKPFICQRQPVPTLTVGGADRIYLLYATTSSYGMAEALCANNHDGHLVSLHSLAEEQSLVTSMKAAFQLPGMQSLEVWLGLTNAEHDPSTLRWLDGTPFDYAPASFNTSGASSLSSACAKLRYEVEADTWQWSLVECGSTDLLVVCLACQGAECPANSTGLAPLPGGYTYHSIGTHGIAHQSSQYANPLVPWFGAAWTAVDGNSNGIYYSGSCAMTDKAADVARNITSYWAVDLQTEQPIHAITIHARRDWYGTDTEPAAARNQGMEVRVGSVIPTDDVQTSGTLCASGVDVPRGGAVSVDCGGQRARYVTIRVPRAEYLTLCEVSVYTVIKTDPFDHGNYLESFPVAVLSTSPVPPPRQRHAAAFAPASAFALATTYPQGALLVHGGTVDPEAEEPAALLSDLWLFDVATHVWSQVQAVGDPPPARQGHSLVVSGSQAYLSGGLTHDGSDWRQSADLYALDLSRAPLTWRRYSGLDNEGVYVGARPRTPISSLAALDSFDQVVLHHQADLLWVPLPTIWEPMSDVTYTKVVSKLNSMFDGDSLMLCGATTVVLGATKVINVRSAVAMNGRCVADGALAPAAAGRRRLQQSGGRTVLDCAGGPHAIAIFSDGAALEGFEFRNCTVSAVLVNVGSPSGSVSASITDCLFVDNSGRGVHVQSGTVTVYGSEFNRNAGGAVAVDSGGRVSSIAFTAFADNGSPGAAGAVRVAPGGALLEVSHSAFTGNRGLNGAAVSVTNPAQTSLAITNTTFELNTAGTHGGALHLDNILTANVTLTACTLNNNTAAAGSGGAVYVASSSQSVEFSGGSMTGNSAGASGGAVYASLTSALAFSGVTLSSNQAVLQGGAVAQETTGRLQMDTSVLAYNSAKLGGGLYVGSLTQMALTSTTLHANSAKAGGGAMCNECESATVNTVSLTNNTAAVYGAGAALLSAGAASSFSAVTATGNAAAGSEALASPDGCGTGGGGALCVKAAAPVTLTSCTVSANSAVYGGGAFVTQDMARVVVASSATVAVVDGSYANNVAASGAGGAIYWMYHDGFSTTCAGGAPSHSPCAAGWSGNTAPSGYGPVMASASYSLALPLTLTSSGLAAYYNTPLSGVTLDVKDWYGQTVSVGPDAATLVTANGTSLAGTVTLTTASGAGTYSDLRVIDAVGANHTLVFVGSAPSGRPLAPATLTVALSAAPPPPLAPGSVGLTPRPPPPPLRPGQSNSCSVGEIYDSPSGACVVCALNTFSFSPANPSCDVCPVDALCPPAPGFVLVPTDGHWHSSAMSPQVHACPNHDACAYATRAQDVMAYQVAMGGDFAAFSAPTYDDIMCAAGYTGNLCASCAPGYGRNGESYGCVDCIDSAGGAGFVYLLLLLIPAALILLSVCFVVRDMHALKRSDAAVSTDPLELLLASRRTTKASPDVGPPGSRTKRKLTWDSMSLYRDFGIGGGKAAGGSGGGRTTSDAPPASLLMPGAAATHSMTAATRVNHRVTFEDEVASRRATFEDTWQAPQRLPAPADPGAVAAQDTSPSADQQSTTPRKAAAAAAASPGKLGGRSILKDAGGGKALGLFSNSASKLTSSGDGPLDPYKAMMHRLRGFGPNHGTALKILISYLHVVVLLREVRLAWPSFAQQYWDWVSLFCFTPGYWAPLDCLLSPSAAAPLAVLHTVVSVSLLPVFLLAGLLATLPWLAPALRAWSKARGRRSTDIVPIDAPSEAQKLSQQLRAWGVKSMVTVAVVLFYLYPNVSKHLVAIFSCDGVDAGGTSQPYWEYALAVQRYWTADYTTRCFVGPHATLTYALGIPGLILVCVALPVAVPLFVLWRSGRLRNTLQMLAMGGVPEAAPESSANSATTTASSPADSTGAPASCSKDPAASGLGAAAAQGASQQPASRRAWNFLTRGAWHGLLGKKNNCGECDGSSAEAAAAGEAPTQAAAQQAATALLRRADGSAVRPGRRTSIFNDILTSFTQSSAVRHLSESLNTRTAVVHQVSNKPILVHHDDKLHAFATTYGALLKDYRGEFFFWDSVVMARCVQRAGAGRCGR